MLLLDEPLGALDLKLRRQMQIELKRIQTEIGITFVHVTHDQEEAMTMADTIAVMNHGVIEQMGAPGELYENPQTTFVANFLGQSNLIMTERDRLVGRRRRGRLPRPEGRRRREPLPHDGRTRLARRPAGEDLRQRSRLARTTAGANVLTGGRVTDVSFVGVSTQYLVAMPWGQEIMVFEQNTGQRAPFRNGDEVDLAWSRGARVPARRRPGRARRA